MLLFSNYQESNMLLHLSQLTFLIWSFGKSMAVHSKQQTKSLAAGTMCLPSHHLSIQLTFSQKITSTQLQHQPFSPVLSTLLELKMSLEVPFCNTTRPQNKLTTILKGLVTNDFQQCFRAQQIRQNVKENFQITTLKKVHRQLTFYRLTYDV